MRIGIVGSRTWSKPGLVVRYISQLADDTIVVSGGASGVDSIAESTARSLGLAVDIYPAKWELYGRSAGPIRNKLIVNNSDEIIAFWDGSSSGTKDTIEYAQSMGKLVTIIYE